MSELPPPAPGFFRVHIQDHADSDTPPPPRILEIPIENIRMVPIVETPVDPNLIMVVDVPPTPPREEPLRLIPKDS